MIEMEDPPLDVEVIQEISFGGRLSHHGEFSVMLGQSQQLTTVSS